MFSEKNVQAIGQLDERKIEILQAKSEGLTNQQVGRRLSISENTVGTHLKQLCAKLERNSLETEKDEDELENRLTLAVSIAAHIGLLTKPRLPPLSKAELPLVQLLIHGYSNRRMGEVLHLSVNTIKTHLHRMMRRYNLQSRFQLAAFVILNKLI